MHIKALWSVCVCASICVHVWVCAHVCLCVCTNVYASVRESRGSLRAVIDLTKLRERFYSYFHIHVTSAFSVSRPWQHYPPLYGRHLCMGGDDIQNLDPDINKEEDNDIDKHPQTVDWCFLWGLFGISNQSCTSAAASDANCDILNFSCVTKGHWGGNVENLSLIVTSFFWGKSIRSGAYSLCI